MKQNRWITRTLFTLMLPLITGGTETASWDLATPVMTSDAPAPGKRVRQVAPEYEGTDVYHTLYLPVDWKPGGRYPVIVEYTGNQWSASGATGEVKDANLGYGMSGGKGYIWITMPYVEKGQKKNALTWWGDRQATIDYCKANLPRICEQFGGDPENVFLCGFSRGAIAASYIGLADDEMASLWKAVFTHDHFDGQQEWGYPESDRASALERLSRLKGRPVLVCGSKNEFLKDHLELARFTFLKVPTTELFTIPEGKVIHPHTDLWMHKDSEYRRRARAWLADDLDQSLPHRGAAEVTFGTVNGEEQMVATSGDRRISGVYPHLTTYSQSRKDGRFFKAGHEECGIGAVIPWADRLWMITYAPHKPRGSDHKLYSIDKDLNMTIHAESVGGTPAARMIHEESGQLFIAHYAIDQQGGVRVIDPEKMPARVTAFMRHLTDPENKVYLFDMENMFYELDVHTLEFQKLFHNPIPGYHGKGGFTSQGKVVVSNNGESEESSQHWRVSQDFAQKGPEDRGCLATFDGTTWEIIERRQYTEVTGPEGVTPTSGGKDDPVWAIGWDKRSLRLQVMEDGTFSTFLLPKGCLNNDARHGWFTEWPRIRDVGEDALLMDMHGMFFTFPQSFTAGNCGGVGPIASHIRYIPDFCLWNGQLVLATDEASIQGNPMVGQPQSSLWFGDFDDLKEWGPRNAAGSIYMNDPVKAGEPSAPFLMNGFPRRVVHLAADRPVTFTLEIDRKGNGSFEKYQRIEVDGYAHHIFPEELDAQWIRVQPDQDCRGTVSFHFSDDVYRDASEGESLFASLADVSENQVHASYLFPNAQNRNLSVVDTGGAAYEFDQVNFNYRRLPTEPLARDCQGVPALKERLGEQSLREFLTPHAEFSVDDASVILVSQENRSIVGQKGNRTVLRLPKGPAAYDQAFRFGHPRMHREVESERMMANIHGTFYEVPFWIVGQPALYTKMRPVSTHNRQISDFATWNGLLVLAGLKPDAEESDHVYRSWDDKTSLWFGGIDDLWKFGKPVGVGGPWKNTDVKAGVPSDPYLMTGYDKKTLELTVDQDCTITVEVDVDHWTGFHRYKSFKLKAGKKRTHEFPEGFAAHWVRVRSDQDVNATAWFIYE